MSAEDSIIETEAIDWLIRVNSSDFGDWDALSAWMARSDDHARAFNALAALDHAYAAGQPRDRRNPFHGGGLGHAVMATKSGWWQVARGRAAAAAVMALVALVSIFTLFPRTSVIETRPGEMREVVIAQGVRVHLNGDTRIEYSGQNPDKVDLVRGEALFDVTNGATRPFEVTAGEIVMRDLGTTFNVIHSPSVTELAVSSGRVMFDSKGLAIVLAKGEAARVAGPRSPAERFGMPADSIAGWRSGRLVYRNASLAQIAEDLARRSGARISVTQQAAERRFTGTIGLGQNADDTLNKVAPLLGVEAHRDEAGWILDAAAR